MIRAKNESETVDQEESGNWQHLQDTVDDSFATGTGRRGTIVDVNFRYPIFLDLTGKKCLVTGEGFEIAAKVRALVEAAARVIYVNPNAEQAIQTLVEAGQVEWARRAFTPEDLTGCFLVISDVDDNADVFRLAEAQNILCNSVDDPKFCRFSFGSLHRQGDLTIAISTNGRAPAVAVRLRERFEREIGPEYALLLAILKEIRPEIAGRISDFSTRRDLWYRIVDSDALPKLKLGDEAGANAMIRELLDDAFSNTSRFDICGDDAGQ